jgi:2-dehydropantoate 2-reductase
MGGVGGLVGALLAKAGDEVTAVLRPETLTEFPPLLSLESPLGSFSVHVKQRATVVNEPFDILWITVKATHLEEALASIESASGIGAIVPLLNGIDHLPLLRTRFGDERLVPATISVESERVAPGKIVHRSPFLRLNVSTRGEARLSLVVEKLRKVGCSAQFVADEPTLMWSKLAFLAPFALTTSAARTAIGDVVSDPAWKTRLERCCAEACAVGIASGAHLDSARMFESFASLPKGLRSSMQKDVAAGNTPELDAIAGPILRRGQKFGIDVSVTTELAEAVRAQVPACP